MKDRLPTYPGRVTLTLVDGEPNVYDVAMADEPSIVGTPLNKETLLNDTAAIMAGVDYLDNPTVSDAFIALRLVADGLCLVHLQVTVNGEPAVAGIPVTGLTDFNGNTPLLTDENGRVDGYSHAMTTTLATSVYVDLSGSQSINTPTGQIVERTFALTREATKTIDYTSSTTIQFSPYTVTDSYVDICCVGGGGGGGGVRSVAYGSGGGGGGYVTNLRDAPIVANTPYNIIVGTGGSAGSWGGSSAGSKGVDGGVSSFGSLLSANGGVGGEGVWSAGGAGGAGNGAGGNGAGNSAATAGKNGTVRKFGDSNGALFGGGGGGGLKASGTAKAGGSPYGGAGATPGANNAGAAIAGTGYGGGGGGGANSASSATNRGFPAKGYQGLVSVRWRART